MGEAKGPVGEERRSTIEGGAVGEPAELTRENDVDEKILNS